MGSRATAAVTLGLLIPGDKQRCGMKVVLLPQQLVPWWLLLAGCRAGPGPHLLKAWRTEHQVLLGV